MHVRPTISFQFKLFDIQEIRVSIIHMLSRFQNDGQSAQISMKQHMYVKFNTDFANSMEQRTS